MHVPIQNDFLEKWGERNNKYLLVALSSYKGNQTETIEEFNRLFD